MTNVTCLKVGLEYFDEAPSRYTTSQEMAATPNRILDVLMDGPSWAKWVFPISASSGPPRSHSNGAPPARCTWSATWGHEEFLAFEHGRRMAFRFNEVSKAASKHAEDPGDWSWRCRSSFDW